MSCISDLSLCFPEQLCLWLLLCSITQYPCYVDNSDLCLYPMRHFTNTGLVLSGSLMDVGFWNLPKDTQIMVCQCWFQIWMHHHCSAASPACPPSSPWESSAGAGGAQCLRHGLSITPSTAPPLPHRHLTEPCLKASCTSPLGLVHALIV